MQMPCHFTAGNRQTEFPTGYGVTGTYSADIACPCDIAFASVRAYLGPLSTIGLHRRMSERILAPRRGLIEAPQAFAP